MLPLTSVYTVYILQCTLYAWLDWKFVNHFCNIMLLKALWLVKIKTIAVNHNYINRFVDYAVHALQKLINRE